MGEETIVGYVDESLSSQTLVNDATDLLANRLFPERNICEWESGFLLDYQGVPLWRGDVVQLHGKGSYYITSFGVDFVKMPNPDLGDDFEWQDAKYTGELIEKEEVPV
jgi:hypothetical protein